MMRMVVGGGRKKKRKMLQWRVRTTLLLFMSPEERKWLPLSLDDIKEIRWCQRVATGQLSDGSATSTEGEEGVAGCENETEGCYLGKRKN